jgi:hypothetical protein
MSEMSSPISHAHISGEASTNGTKRKRTALSCYECRRRKLRCDREYPSCGRCRKTGQASSCSYDERSLQSRQTESSVLPLPERSTTTPQAPSPWSSSNPAPHPRQISRIENRPSTLEASQTSGTWQVHGQVSSACATTTTEQRPAIKADTETFPTSPRDSTVPKTVIFKGLNFKTQYYGGTNPTSLIAHVGCPGLFCGRKTDDYSFRNFDHS